MNKTIGVKGLFFLLLLNNVHASAVTLQAPEHGAYQGAYADFGPLADAVSVEKIRAFEKLTQKKMVWAYFADNWTDGKIVFPRENVEACLEAGVIPYIRLMPWSKVQTNASGADPIFNMDAFLKGEHDAALIEYAREIKKITAPLILEFGPEVNGSWFSWNGRWNGGNSKNDYGDPQWPDGPEKFRDVYRRLINLFRAEGVNNVTWVLHLDTAWAPTASWNEAQYYYPGDDFIDWIGLSVFGAQLPSHDWSSFRSKFSTFWKQVEEMSKSKPILISEFAVIEDRYDSRRKPRWLEEALSFIASGEFSRIKGINYWHSAGWLENGKASFRIDSSSPSLSTYLQEISKPFWLESGIFSEQ